MKRKKTLWMIGLFLPLISVVLSACVPVRDAAPTKEFDYIKPTSAKDPDPAASAEAVADESDWAVWELPNKARALTPGLRDPAVSKVAQITGEDSENRTLTRFNVWGTDLGSMTEMNGKVYNIIWMRAQLPGIGS